MYKSSFLITEIINHPSSLLISLFGMSLIYYMLYKTADFRYGPSISVMVMTLLWSLRYFGFGIYVSKYLSRKYSEEEWFLNLTGILSLLVVFLGIFLIALIYKGNLLKNLLITGLSEIFVSMIFLMPGAILSKEPHLERSFMRNSRTPLEIILIILLFILCFFAVIKIEPLLERYRNWEPKHPVVLTVLLALYYVIGMISNIRYAMAGGKTHALLFIPLVILILAFLMFGYFNDEWTRKIKKRNELQRYEESIMKHYRHLMIQSVRVDSYNQEIRKAIADLTEKVIRFEAKNQSAENSSRDKENMSENTQNTKNLAREYLSRLEQVYAGLSFSKYSDDIWLNEFLTEYEQKFAKLYVPVRFFLFPSEKPEGIGQQDCEDLMNMLFDKALASYSSGTVTEDSLVSLLGGRTGTMNILSFEYDGSKPTGITRRKIIRQAKKMNLDIEMEEKNGRTKIIMAFPSN